MHFRNKTFIILNFQGMFQSNVDHLQLEVKVKKKLLFHSRLQKQWLLREYNTTICFPIYTIDLNICQKKELSEVLNTARRPLKG